jgi:RimJ/RimL family protein N-acetyltransferase
MLHFEPTRDLGYVRLVATTPRLWEHLSDDFSGPREAWQPPAHDAITYLKVTDDEQCLGFFMLVQQSPVLWEVHTALLPAAWGACGREAAQGLIAWVFAHSTCQRLITSVPASNRLALRFALRAGMTEFGRNPRAYQTRGQLEDLILLGLSRP